MERHTKGPEHGLDSRWSWIVSGFCCWAMLTSTLSVRAGGVIFAQVVQSFDVTREEASMPLTAQFISYYLSAIFHGYLIEAYSCRAVFLACTLTASVSISLCYFAPSLAFITFFFGVLHGGSLTGIAMSTLTILCQHFKRWQATACSLTLSSTGVSVFFIPQLVSYWITMYGTLEAFLFLGAMTLNTLPAVIILRSPPWLSRCQRSTLSSFKFLVDALSVAVQLYVIVTFVVVHVDLAQDRGVPPDRGLIASLPPILLLKDFREYSLPMTMGAVGFISGLILMTKPALFGYFRDYFGKYDGVLHTLAAVNGLLCTVWIFRRARLQRGFATTRRLASL
ncbi:uncharacterized protein ISCGN_006961 [Ixodes scapularis]